MRRAAWLVAGAAAVAVAAAPAGPPAREVFTVEAIDATVRADVLVVVDPDGATVRGIDVRTGDERWRAPLGGPAKAAVIHDLGEGRLLVQSPGRYATIADGRVVATRNGPPDWRFVWRRHGACGLRGPCELQPIACEDGRALGPVLRDPPPSLRFAEEGGDAGTDCDSSLDVLGRAGDLSLYLLGRGGVVAIDDQGERRWQEDVGCSFCTPIGSGVATDGSVCWTTGLADDGGYVLRAFACATGKPLFSRAVVDSARHPKVVTGWADGGLFVQDADRAVLLYPNGRERWSRAVEPGDLVVPDGMRVADYPLALDGFQELTTIRRDAVVHTRAPTLHIDDVAVRLSEVRVVHGEVTFAEAGWTADRAGTPVRPPATFAISRSASGSTVTRAGQTVLALAGDAWALGELHEATKAWLVVAEPRHGRPDLVHVVAGR